MKTNAENQSANVQILQRNCIGNQYPVRKNSIYKRSRLKFLILTVCFMLASHPRKVNRLNSDQRRKCACAARGFVPGRNEALHWSFPGDSPCNGISSLPSPCTASFQALSVNAFSVTYPRRTAGRRLNNLGVRMREHF